MNTSSFCIISFTLIESPNKVDNSSIQSMNEVFLLSPTANLNKLSDT